MKIMIQYVSVLNGLMHTPSESIFKILLQQLEEEKSEALFSYNYLSNPDNNNLFYL